ncbi:uncharacterized [Tachysurus ichikawai]
MNIGTSCSSSTYHHKTAEHHHSEEHGLQPQGLSDRCPCFGRPSRLFLVSGIMKGFWDATKRSLVSYIYDFIQNKETEKQIQGMLNVMKTQEHTIFLQQCVTALMTIVLGWWWG